MTTDSQAYKEWARLRLAANKAPLVTAAEEPLLIARAKAGDRAALSRLLEGHRRLVIETAARYARGSIPPRDLVGEGTVGLLEAIRRCQPEHGTRLSTYARWWIRARVRAFALANRNIVALPTTRNGRRTVALFSRAERALLHSLGRMPTRQEIASRIGVQESDVDAVVAALSSHDMALGEPGEESWLELSAQAETPEDRFADAEQSALLRRVAAQLPAREAAILVAQLEDEDLKYRELARTLGVTSQRTSQLAASARERMRRALLAAS